MDWKEMGIARYRVWYDKINSNFRILDVWHDSIKNIPENQLNEDIISEDSPAVRILNLDEVNSLIEKLKEMGWLEKYIKVESQISPIVRSKTLQEIAIEKIHDIAQIDNKNHDSTVAREGVLAIREIMNRIGS